MYKKRKVRRTNCLILITVSLFMIVLFNSVSEDKDEVGGINSDYMSNEKGIIPLSVEEIFRCSMNQDCLNLDNVKCIEILEKYEEEKFIFLKTNDML